MGRTVGNGWPLLKAGNCISCLHHMCNKQTERTALTHSCISVRVRWYVDTWAPVSTLKQDHLN